MRVGPGKQRRARAADVQEAGGTRGETRADVIVLAFSHGKHCRWWLPLLLALCVPARRAAANRSTGSSPTRSTSPRPNRRRGLNLRGTRGATVFWLGHYRPREEFQQTRTGIEQTLSFSWGKAV